MNEVTRIHLGRQPFTISVAAHRALKAYLADIQKQVADPDVANEVELRMTELLLERGITGDKVVLPEDVEFLQQQLGDPADFSDDAEAPAVAPDSQAPKRLFRDIDNAMIAGVSAGIASYFGLDATLVRLLFVLLAIFSGGVGIVLYVVLWIAVPAAETASEKLQMQGKSVTLGALKDSVAKADIAGAARRGSNTLLPVINSLFGLIVKLTGLGFIVAGLGTILTVAAIKAYMLLHHDTLFQENLFPVGVREHWLVGVAMGLTVLGAVFLLLIGVATFKRKWPIRAWATGVLVGLFTIGLAACLALSADIAPRVNQRYEETLHTTAVQNIDPFTTVKTTGNVDIAYISAPNYAVNYHYSGNPDVSKIKVSVTDGTLYVDATNFNDNKPCSMLCLFPHYNFTVQIYAPNVRQFDTPPSAEMFYPSAPALN